MKTKKIHGWSKLLICAALLAGCAKHDESTKHASDWLQQNAHEFASVDPANEDFSDLNSFGDAVGDARIVSMGEQTHGAGTVFDLKMRLVKYLHEKKGFDVLMMESSLFDVSRVWQLAQEGQSVDALAPDVMFFMYAKSAQARKTLQYVDRQRTTGYPLMLVGMDSQQNGKRSHDDLLPMLEVFLASRQSAIAASADWPAYKELVLLGMSGKTKPAQAKLAAFYAESDKLEAQLCISQADTFSFPTSPGLWCRVVKSLRNQADRYWGGEKNRDIDMAANAQWLLEHSLTGHKVIIWAHTIHAGRFGAGGNATMGSELHRYYGKQMYVVNFTTSQGRHVDFTDMQIHDVTPDAEGSVELALHQLKKPYLFVDARKNTPPAMTALIHKEFDYQYLGPTSTRLRNTRALILGWVGVPTFDLGVGYDGLFYTETTQAVTMSR